MSRVIPPCSRLCKFLIVVFLLSRCLTASPVLAEQVPASALQNRVTQLLSQPRFESGFWGVHIVSLKNSTVIFSSNAKKRFIPGSNMKLLIGAAALDRLGADFRFETPVFAEGRIDSQGRLLGNLILVGRGDPNLESRSYDPDQEELPANDIPLFISKVVDQVMERGVRTIVGDIIADETQFLNEPIGPSWAMENLPWSYGAPVSSLAVNENVFRLEFLPGETAGSQALARTYPSETGIQVLNQVSTVIQGKSPSMHMEPSRDGWKYIFRGVVPIRHPGLKYNLSVADPGEFAALLLRSALVRHGVIVTGKTRTRQLQPLDVFEEGKLSLEKAKPLQGHYPDERKVATIRTLPLLETLKILMKNSHNLYAEMLLRALGATASGVGSVETGVGVLEEFLAKVGIAKGMLSIDDGSGLSRKDLVTPESIVQLLEYMDRHPLAAQFLDLLPVAGRDGTLKNRMKKSLASERIFAKTGTIEFVATLSGFAVAKTGEKLAFSIMVNHERAGFREVREAMDEICDWMVEYDSTRESAGGAARN